MIQTSYVPLEKPYQIVEYNGNLGIQVHSGVHSGTDPTVHTDGEITDVKT